MKLNRQILSLILASSFALSLGAQDIVPYDEVKRAPQKNKRLYENIQRRLSVMPEEQKKKLAEESFKYDNCEFDTFPNLVSEDDFNIIKAGAAQRARALKAFLIDLYSGQEKAIKEGVISRELLEQILKRSGELEFKKFAMSHQDERKTDWDQYFQFTYGPDIVRGPNGQFYVVEDNMGNIGGMEDVAYTEQFFMKNLPGFVPKKDIIPGENTYKDLVGKLMDNQGKSLKAENIIYYYKPFFKPLGALITKEGVTGLPFKDQSLDFIPKGKKLFYKNKEVGTIFVMGDPKRLLKREGLLKSALYNRVKVVNFPGISILGDKEMYQYVHKFIRFFLNEEPILNEISTFPVQMDTQEVICLNKDGDLHRVEDFKSVVVKLVNGHGGDRVYVFNKMNDEKIAASVETIKGSLKEGSQYIAQDYVPLSLLNDNIVDLRPFSLVGPKGDVYVLPKLMGRGVDKNCDGKVNVSSKGRVFFAPIIKNGDS